ncbi:MAG: PEGA domain-containing protein [Phycisphaerae bacterium]
MRDRLGWRLGLPGLAIMMLIISGCVRRTMTINTAPQGARVILNDQEVGTSPVSIDFTWYGDYSVILEKEGYRTLQTNQFVATPWYQTPGIDFFAEVLWPFPVHDKREYTFELEPAGEPISREELLKNAEEFRDRAIFGED